jgi:xanthine dehydrogenase/oxidase
MQLLSKFHELILTLLCPVPPAQVDPSAALRLPGVVGYFGAKDVPGDNMIGPIMHDEEVFATDKVMCVGQVCVCCGE